MKEWLKHKFGFLNIDDEFIFVTKTGNWSEIEDLEEKNHKGFKTNTFASKLKIGLYVTVVYGLFVFCIVRNIISGNISFLLIIGLPVLAYYMFQYLIPEYGASFRIPKDKINQIYIDGDSVSIEFLDADNKMTTNNFRGLDEKGIAILETVKISLNV